MIHWATRRPAVVLAASVAILLAGGVSFTRLALATRTSIELPRLNVNATWPGASAELVETYLTSPIEAVIQGVRGVRRTSSQSRDETASLTVELEPKADVQLARLGILERLELLRPEFPPGSSAPIVSNYVPENLEEQPLLLFTVSGPYTPGTLQKLADEKVNPRLSAVAGVSGISVQGGTELGVSVSYDAALLRHWGFIEERGDERPDGNPRAGYYRITPAGRDFACGRASTHQAVFLYNNRRAGQTAETVTIREALGSRFNYNELMAS